MKTPFGIDLGDEALNAKVNGLRERMSRQYSLATVIQWNGSKIPRGAKVGNDFISWTQHGIVNAGGKSVGMYDRLVEFGENELQVMVVYTNERVTSSADTYRIKEVV